MVYAVTDREAPLTISEVFDEFVRLALQNLSYLLGAFAAITALLTAWDLATNSQAQFIPAFVVSIYAQVLVIERLLADRLPNGRGYRRYLSIFGSSLLTGLGTALATLLLILPGIYVSGRWAVTSPVIIAENQGTTGSMQRSWDITARSQRTLFAIFLIAWAVIAASTFANISISSPFPWLMDLDAEPVVLSSVSVLAINVVGTATYLASWLLSTSIYRCMTTTTGELDSVFA